MKKDDVCIAKDAGEPPLSRFARLFRQDVLRDSITPAMRQHMTSSLFCGQYPLEMRYSRRPKDSVRF